MSKPLQQLITGLVLVVIGAIFVAFYANTNVRFYLAKSFHVPALIGGLSMLVIGLFLILQRNKDQGCCHHDHEDMDEEHDHETVNPVTVILCLFAPFIYATSITEHKPSNKVLTTLSDETPDPRNVQQGKSMQIRFTKETLDEIKTKTADGAYQIPVIELFWSASDPEMESVLKGLRIETIGKIRTKPGAEEDPTVRRLYTLFMTCCATDMQAIPIGLKISAEESAKFKEHDWVKLAGTVEYAHEYGRKYLVLKVDRIQPQETPKNEYDVQF